jgi:hypothetical protein
MAAPVRNILDATLYTRPTGVCVCLRVWNPIDGWYLFSYRQVVAVSCVLLLTSILTADAYHMKHMSIRQALLLTSGQN